MEDGEETHVEMERQVKKKVRVKRKFRTAVRTKTQQNAVRLHELGPRLTLSLVKVQEGFCDGQVLYHQFGTNSYYYYYLFIIFSEL
jgi:ribosome biogenesis protein SSF1/2